MNLGQPRVKDVHLINEIRLSREQEVKQVCADATVKCPEHQFCFNFGSFFDFSVKLQSFSRMSGGGLSGGEAQDSRQSSRKGPPCGRSWRQGTRNDGDHQQDIS